MNYEKGFPCGFYRGGTSISSREPPNFVEMLAQLQTVAVSLALLSGLAGIGLRGQDGRC